MKFWRLCVVTIDRSSRTDKKFHSLTMGFISLPGLLNMFEVMPMLMGSKMALKATEMKKIGGVCTRTSPLPPLLPSITVTGTVVVVVVIIDIIDTACSSSSRRRRRRRRRRRKGQQMRYDNIVF
jgi:hypothetical protein